MHDTVVKVRKAVRAGTFRDNVADTVSKRLQGGGLTRALSEPLAAQFEILYREAMRWLRLAEAAVAESGADALAELEFSSRRLHSILLDLVPFLERAEDNLSERDEVTHRESGYEREVTPFTRLDSTQPFRAFLAAHPEFGVDLAGNGAQMEADLLKVVYLEEHLDFQAPKPADLYAMLVELLLDARRHLIPNLRPGSEFMDALGRAAGGGA